MLAFDYQFYAGGLAPSVELIRMVEDIYAQDDTQMQKGYQSYGDCGGIGLLFVMLYVKINFHYIKK
jgi:hypothetical protein